MTLSIKENSWLKAGIIFGTLIVLFVLWAYLAGGMFLMAYDKKFGEATPLTYYQYWYHYGADQKIRQWLYIAGGIALVVTLSPFYLLFAPAKRSLFGDARFAKKSEIAKAGLLGEDGIIVGQYHGRYMMFGGSQHAILSAPTRSGKGVGVVIPNLLNWPQSVVVLDIKQENWNITSGYRQKHGQACYLFNPLAKDYRSHRYNPLSYINPDPNFRIDDIQKIASMLFPDQQGTDVIWTATPRSLFLGIVLFLLESPQKPVTLGQVLRETLANGDGSEYFKGAIADRAAAGNPFSDACVRALNTYITINADTTRSGIVAGFRSRLELWNNPLIDAATSANDFDLRETRSKRMSIYIGITPDNLDRVGPLINLFFQQLIDLNTRELPQDNPALKYSCLLLMDEFTSIGKMGVLSKGISYIAGYGLRMLPIVQSMQQIVETYGKEAAETFQTNHALQMIFAPKATETRLAKDISESLGYQTVRGVSESKGKGIFNKKNKSESHSDQRRALLLPQEITGIGQSKCLVVVENVPPILASKVVYFKDKAFTQRLKSVSPTLSKAGKFTQGDMNTAINRGELAATVPLIDVEANNTASATAVPATVAPAKPNAAAAKPSPAVKTRAVTAADMQNLGKMRLSEFAVDFSTVQKPQGQLTPEQLIAYADNMCVKAGVPPMR